MQRLTGTRFRIVTSLAGAAATMLISTVASASEGGHEGYYRQPSIHGDTIVFVAEGDLWKTSADGGDARRLTTHPEEETQPAISPDGSTVAFMATYEGPSEVYTMPVDGGVPTRVTYGTDFASVVGWTPDGRLVYRSRHDSTLPNYQLYLYDAEANTHERVPLEQAWEGAFNADGDLVFTRLPYQGSATKRYKGGTARQLWRFNDEMDEAVGVTTDYDGESQRAMWWEGRVYHVTDRDGTMNIWSMQPDGSDLKQHTAYDGFDVLGGSLHDGRIVYQVGASIHRYDIGAATQRELDINLMSDLDQMREYWLDDPMSFLTSAQPSPDGDRVVLTARGEIFVVPVEHGRTVHIDRNSGVRYRQAQFLPDGERLVFLSDESGEIELWTAAANGLDEPNQEGDEATIYQYNPVVSPDGRWVAYQDKDRVLWLHDMESGERRVVNESRTAGWDEYEQVVFSPGSEWIAYTKVAENTYRQVRLYNIETGETFYVTSDRVNSNHPAFTPDGKWLFFLSERNFQSATASPWGHYAPQPLLDRLSRLYVVSLTEERRSPFLPDDEVMIEQKKAEEKAKEEEAASADDAAGDDDAAPDDDAADPGEEAAEAAEDEEDGPKEVFDLEGILDRAILAPVPPGNYANLQIAGDNLYWMSRDLGQRGGSELRSMKITNAEPKVSTVAEGVATFQVTLDGKKLLVRTRGGMQMADANGQRVSGKTINLGGWTFPIDPREEWQQMFVESWRLMRDYFWDPGMHGVDWDAMLEKYRPLAARVTTRQELSDLMAQMVAELSALHTFVRSGPTRQGDDQVSQGHLGARLRRSADDGGYVIEHLYRAEPNFPDRQGPLNRPDLGVSEGDVILAVNGDRTLDEPHIGELLRGTVGRDVRLRLRDVDAEAERDLIVTPISAGAERNLRYNEWKYTRRRMVDELGDQEIGYVHVQAMGGGNYAEWAENFFPVFNRKGLIIDMRHNRGGNIDSWLLTALVRQHWMYWQGRTGTEFANMQYAFHGHMVVLCNERTASDGEAFTDGFRRLGLGKVIGTRTWGGEIWLSSSNILVDNGIASAAEFGVYGPEGEWLIEGWGVDPDIVVDNLPHETFNGRDAQVEAAVRYLLEKLDEEPMDVPKPPPFPDKSFRNGPGN